jgi:uncharacterized membrane protein YgcG
VRRRGAAGLGTTSSWQRRETRRCTLRWPRSRWWCDRLQGIACMHYFAAQHCAAWSNTYKNSLMFTNRFGLRRELGLGLWYCRYLLAVLPCRCHLDERVRDHSVREHVLLLPFDHPWVTLLAQARGGGGDRIVILARDGIGSRWRGRACLLLRGALRCTPATQHSAAGQAGAPACLYSSWLSSHSEIENSPLRGSSSSSSGSSGSSSGSGSGSSGSGSSDDSYLKRC